jgi:hypothetical protein
MANGGRLRGFAASVSRRLLIHRATASRDVRAILASARDAAAG